ncbi:cytoplasmic protein [Pseudozyma hubeiensis SY62]|uniref:Cytoplasmic protein n=1 Tax=Pseudozyma hubeiensis (strain SY62) TaxID=1305764 RepID=R9PEF2_PSEHS|nr:cytoplasmic protein [Pseudozyma hubeiensis SY62]GAC99731.1 cytoplasmic protein [Pseudozyma hubeiensis SY62]
MIASANKEQHHPLIGRDRRSGADASYIVTRLHRDDLTVRYSCCERLPLPERSDRYGLDAKLRSLDLSAQQVERNALGFWIVWLWRRRSAKGIGVGRSVKGCGLCCPVDKAFVCSIAECGDIRCRSPFPHAVIVIAVAIAVAARLRYRTIAILTGASRQRRQCDSFSFYTPSFMTSAEEPLACSR